MNNNVLNSKLDLSGDGFAYLRVSDDKQDIKTQRKTINTFETRHGVRVKTWFEDDGWSRDEHDIRPDWLNMLRRVSLKEFKWGVVEAKDRFGTASGVEKVVYYSTLWKSGCKLYDTGDNLLNSPDVISTMMAVLDGDTEAKENKAKSERAINKMRQCAEAGRWTGGPIPFGLDVVCMSVDGRERWRVISEGRSLRIKITPDGKKKRYDGKNNFPSRDASEWLTLRPSENPERLQIIRDIYDWFDREAITLFSIASRLNQQGRRYSENGLGRWDSFAIGYILKNPVYMGYPTFNKSSQGKWNTWRSGQRIESDTPQRRNEVLPRSDWVQPIRQFKPIIADEQWERVIKKLAERKKVPHAPKSPNLWLSGLLICEGCKLPMFGAKRRRGEGVYWCKSKVKKLPDCKCDLNTLPHIEIESHLKKYLADTSQLIAELEITETSKNITDAEHFQSEVQRAMWSYYRMNEVVNGEKYGNNTIRIIAPPSETKADEELFQKAKKYFPIMTPPWETGEDELSEAYRKVFDTKRPKLQAELDQLETSHTRLVETWSDLPTQKAKEKARIRVAELEKEISDLEMQLKNHADEWAEAIETLRKLRLNWQEVSVAVARETSGRKRAGAVRRIVSEIRCKFVPTGLQRPTARLVQVTFVPQIGDSVVVNTDVSARPRRFPSCG